MILSIIIPVFNEEKVIQKTIAQIDCFYKNKNLTTSNATLSFCLDFFFSSKFMSEELLKPK